MNNHHAISVGHTHEDRQTDKQQTRQTDRQADRTTLRLHLLWVVERHLRFLEQWYGNVPPPRRRIARSPEKDLLCGIVIVAQNEQKD